MSPRANLPGADELFRRTGSPAPAPPPSPAGAGAGGAAGPPPVLAYTEAHLTEDPVLASARSRADEAGMTSIGVGTGAALQFLASAIGVKAAVEIGTGGGVSGIWLLRGMRPGGVLTTVDAEPEAARLARRSFTEAGFPTSRMRLITGRPLEVLPRLSDAAYDLVVCSAERNPPSEYAGYLGAALRLLRPGGVVTFDHALWRGQVVDAVARDAETLALRDLTQAVRDHSGLVSALLPVGDGLLAAVKTTGL